MLTLLVVLLAPPAVACQDFQTFNYGRLTVEETADGFTAELNATALANEVNHKGVKAMGWLRDLTLTFPKAACKTSSEHPALITCRTSEETEFSFHKGKDRKAFKATYALLETARVTRITVTGTTEMIEARYRLASGTESLAGLIPFDPKDCAKKKAPAATPTQTPQKSKKTSK